MSRSLICFPRLASRFDCRAIVTYLFNTPDMQGTLVSDYQMQLKIPPSTINKDDSNFIFLMLCINVLQISRNAIKSLDNFLISITKEGGIEGSKYRPQVEDLLSRRVGLLGRRICSG